MMDSSRFKVRWTETAEEDLASIVDYIAVENPDAALAVFERICSYSSNLHVHPERGRIVPELHKFSIAGYCELLPSPWWIIYRVEETTVFVTAVLDGRRDLEDLLLERLTRK